MICFIIQVSRQLFFFFFRFPEPLFSRILLAFFFLKTSQTNKPKSRRKVGTQTKTPWVCGPLQLCFFLTLRKIWLVLEDDTLLLGAKGYNYIDILDFNGAFLVF